MQNIVNLKNIDDSSHAKENSMPSQCHVGDPVCIQCIFTPQPHCLWSCGVLCSDPSWARSPQSWWMWGHNQTIPELMFAEAKNNNWSGIGKQMLPLVHLSNQQLIDCCLTLILCNFLPDHCLKHHKNSSFLVMPREWVVGSRQWRPLRIGCCDIIVKHWHHCHTGLLHCRSNRNLCGTQATHRSTAMFKKIAKKWFCWLWQCWCERVSIFNYWTEMTPDQGHNFYASSHDVLSIRCWLLASCQRH